LSRAGEVDVHVDFFLGCAVEGVEDAVGGAVETLTEAGMESV
jgi:hypothetical protein